MSINQGLIEQQKTPDSILLDVRTPEEYSQGHVPGSINHPVEQIQTFSLPKNQTLFVYCRSGARSGRACQYLNSQGYQAVNIGGILDYQGTIER